MLRKWLLLLLVMAMQSYSLSLLHLFYLLGERRMQFESALLNALVQHETFSKTQKTQTLKFL